MGIEWFFVCVGIHMGLVVVGNVGSEVCMKYFVIGDMVNIVFCVEGFNKVLKIFILVIVVI